MKSELMNEFDLSEEELQAGFSNAKDNFKGALEGALEGKLNENEAAIDVNAEQVVKEVKDTKTNAPQSEAFTDQPIVEEKKVEITTQSSKEGGNKNSLQSGAESSNLFNQVMNNIADAAANVDESDMVSYTDRAQMENIIRQITEKITVSAGPEETSMELQLHPASLGHVNILLTSSKDGITAKFTAQNEIVKEAVESQMTALMQKFDEQGVKVTSVEVTIASHAFEQNLQQEDQQETARDQMEKNKKSLRRINLNEIDEEIEEEMTQAELIAAQMMAYNGNTIDFSA